MSRQSMDDMQQVPAPIEWLEPWYPVGEFGADRAREMSGSLEKQLRREICDRHVLYNESARLIARRADTDDALFALSGGRVAEVHLTWRQGTEPDPRWPATSIFASLDEWVVRSMVPLHEWLKTLD
jgi:hypothetical protein